MNFFYTFYNKKVSPFLLIIFLLLGVYPSLVAQVTSTDWDLNTATARNLSTLPAIPSTALNTTISIENFKRKLGDTKQEISIPNPKGQFETFVIEPTNVVAPEVAHLYTIKTFKGYKKNNPTVLFAGDISDNGFHAAIYAGQGTYFIEPMNTTKEATNQLKVFYKHESKANKVKCLVEKTARQVVHSNKINKRNAPTQKRNFRLAIVATGEYGQGFGGSPYSTTNVLNALASGVNMINPIYLRDVGIDFTLVSTAAMVFENPDTDNFDTSQENAFFENLTNTIVNAIGVNGFDVGHAVIWENLGGLASAGVVCNDQNKAEGYSAANGSTTTLWVDYVAHEIGHQFNADHNFVSTECETSVDGFRYEPGEGSSIMAYADVCGAPAQYASGSDPFFHYASIKTISDFVETTSCATTTTNGNSNDPVSNAQSDITIPKQTPFVLIGSATDGNDAASNLTYSWEQYDGNSSAVNGPPNCNATNAPLFRYRPPNSTGIRSFPQYTDVLTGNNNSMDWEKLPCAARDINFSLAVRDNNPTFGRVTNDLMKITVANTGPFEVTAPNGGESLTGNMASTITWTVNGTDAHCSNVDILLSTDGGGTYTVIADATANDGSESVSIPNNASTTARIIIRCDVTGGFRSASTFYDVSNANFTITAGTAQVVDADMDGIEADNDCNDNDANIGAKQTAGTACDDRNANTTNDVIQADGCGCAGTVIPACANNGGDADNDGICADNDCNDNDANIGAKQTAGTACDDGNANTTNDVIQADGCSCAGTIPPCANNGSDADNDGICADNDCNDNDANIGAKKTAGTACDDGNANTTNDVIQADGCSCAGTIPACANNGGDADNDGICADNDCDDNDANIGAKQTAGTACDDGNANTTNDVIQADGCSCAGTVPACANNGGDADNDGICADNDCNDNDANIGAKQTAGTACDDGNANTTNDVIQADGCSCAGTVPACANNGGDADNDGICADNDCNDNDANIGAKQTAGTACDDGNANTTNDVIQADGCSCAGTVPACANNGGDADNDGICADNDCNDNDANIGAKQTAGTACDDGNANTTNDVILADGCSCAGTVPACANNGGDADNDGICADNDCNDNDANIGAKQTAGTACDDGNANTTNDVIQADGCSCAGTVPACANNGGDADNDGICADNDCNDNDANIGAKQTAGTACDDGNANTTNDVIQADGCSCAGTVPACANNGGDADNDGICADNDCNDNDANIGAKQTAGTACDDGNANTTNDVILADGCSCAGTVPACANNGGDADNDGICADNDCNDNDANIGAKQTAGTACDDGNANTTNDVILADGCSCAGTVPACANNGGDADNDGICADNDCNDNDANIGAKQTVGTACDDGNDNTENDQIQADGCSCAGIVIPACANNGGDADNDGFCADVDCDDNNPNINSSATEIPDNGIDENCDGMDEMTTSMGDACPTPSTTQVINLSNRKTLIEWSNIEMANQYTLQIRFKGQENWIITATLYRSRVFIYGPSGRTYEYRIKSNCANEDSEYTDIFEYSTPTNLNTEIAQGRNSGEEDAIYLDEFVDTATPIKVFPNPVHGELNIQVATDKKGTISIYHTSGLLISRQQIISGKTLQQIGVSHLEAGLYFISVENDGEQSISKRFIKM